MFLFTADRKQLIRHPARSVLSGRPFEHMRSGSAQLSFAEDAFTTVRRSEGSVSIDVRRPVDTEPVCTFQWQLRTGRVTAWRRWSGELAVYHSRRVPLIVTSHLKLACRSLGVTPGSLERLRPGHSLVARTSKGQRHRAKRGRSFYGRYEFTYDQTVAEVRRELCDSLKQLPDGAALLLSGGIDSACLAAAAKLVGKKLQAFVLSLDRRVRDQQPQEDDMRFARLVAEHLQIPLTEVTISAKRLKANLPLAIYLAETPRATIVDECAALIEAARAIASVGHSTAAIGESADDLFGSFKFVLRFYRGQQLRKYYRHSLAVDIPNELSVIQETLRPWGLSLVDPFWTTPLMKIGYNLPLGMRIDKARLMKRALRDAFADVLPRAVIERPKAVLRDSTQVRYALENEFGCSRERFRPIFKRVMAEGLSAQEWRQSGHPVALGSA